MQSQAAQPAGDLVINPGFSLMAASKWICALFVSLWLAIPDSAQTLIWLMAFDYISGTIAAAIEGRFCATELAKGFWKKILTLVLLAALHKATDFLHLGFDMAAVGVVGFIVNEFCSVVRNCARAGVPIPPSIVAAMESAKRLTKKK